MGGIRERYEGRGCIRTKRKTKQRKEERNAVRNMERRKFIDVGRKEEQMVTKKNLTLWYAREERERVGVK